MRQGYQSSPTGFDSQSSPVEGLDDLLDEGATPFVLTRLKRRDKQKEAKKKGKVVAESSDIYTTQLLEFGNDMRERQKSRMEYENRKMNVQERRLEQEKEERAYKRQVREREAKKLVVEKKEREAKIIQQNMAILEKDLSKMTPRKKRFWRRNKMIFMGTIKMIPTLIQVMAEMEMQVVEEMEMKVVEEMAITFLSHIYN
ncbi:unnamed protein product [Linum trigynum]|uniref:Uncharacterized protein n=1 Tax=Linum trigynum TaxID=586398 RepID=A0AAV2GSM7_9ROSI